MKSQMTPGRLALWSLVPLVAWVVLATTASLAAGDAVTDNKTLFDVVGTVLLGLTVLGLVGAGIAKVVQIGVTSSREP